MMNPTRWMAIKIGSLPWLSRYSRLIVGSDRFVQWATVAG